jgi:UDP-2,4-diacetamido-2,4,6-trideoxy-beta-L-altropyranose hydrolase
MMSDKKTITLRELKIEDTKMVFEWRNTPFIKSLSSQNRTVALKEHMEWIANTVQSKTRKAYIILINNETAGQVRFDKENELSDCCVISVYLLENYTGKGIGIKSIKLGCELIKKEWNNIISVRANVLKTNIIGQKAFIKAGFIYKQISGDYKHHCYLFTFNVITL